MSKGIFYVILLVGLLAVISKAEQPQMTVIEMIEYWGYPAEEHKIITEDGYILALHRIPHGANEKAEDVEKQQPKIPVFMGHCLLCSSAIYSFGPPDKSLAYMLADAGYDVWMDNQRGNTWSKDHVFLDTSTNSSEFWHYSWDDSALYDYTAGIDYVLGTTGYSDLFMVGYSMGTSRYFTLLSEKPEYNAKIKAGFMMAPPVIMTNADADIFMLSEEAENIQMAYHETGRYEFAASTEFMHNLAHEVCDDEHPATEHLCENVFYGALGVSEGQLNTSMLSFYLDHVPAGTSTNTLVHYTQNHLATNNEFRRYDWLDENMAIYGQADPPVCDLTLVTAPTAIYVGNGDHLATIADNDLLVAQLPNVIDYHVVEYEGWGHNDFAFAMDANTLVFEKIVDGMNSLS